VALQPGANLITVTLLSGGKWTKAELTVRGAELQINAASIRSVLQVAPSSFLNETMFSADRLHWATVGGNGYVCVWDAHTGMLQRTFAGHAGAVWAVAFSPGGRLLVTGGEDGTVRI
jgi:WD40 repeat protein